jgi:hypothetical protein
MGKVLDVPMIAGLAAGFALPVLGGMVYDKVMSMVPGVPSVLQSGYVKTAALAATSAGLIYAASRYSSMITPAFALTAATVSTFLFVGSAIKQSGVLNNVPYVSSMIDLVPASLSGSSGYLGGYSGGYLGYLGNEHSGMGMDQGNLYGDAPAEQAQLFGNVGSSPQVNIF